MFRDALIYRLYNLHKILSFREVAMLWYFTGKNILSILDESLIPKNCLRYDIDDMRILPVVKQILNHASIQTTMRYAHTMREQEILAVEALANFQ